MSYVSNAPSSHDHDDEIVGQAVRIFILPAWIYQSFTAKFSLNEIHEYAKLRQVASINDVAQLEILRDLINTGNKISVGDTTPYYDLDSFIRDLGYWRVPLGKYTTEGKAEIANSVAYYVNDADTKESLISRLTKHEDIYAGCDVVASGYFPSDSEKRAAEDNKPLYRVAVMNDSLYIIVEEGFLSQMENPANRKAFLTQVLKSAYAIAPVGVVNRSVFYEQYVKALAE